MKTGVLTVVAMHSYVFWNIMPCRRLKMNRRFGGACRLHVQCWRVSQANQHEAGSKQSGYCDVEFQRTTWHYIPEYRNYGKRECGINFQVDNAVEQIGTYGVLEEMEREYVIHT
jgi:hypothetical protein